MIWFPTVNLRRSPRRRHLAVAVEAGEGVGAGEGAGGEGEAGRRVRDICGLFQSRQDCSDSNFIAFLNDSAPQSLMA